MEGEKEREREHGEEKESNEAEDDTRSDEDADNEEEEEEQEEQEQQEGAVLVWQEGFSEDSLGLPIMHWEALSLRIAELEKQEEEKKEKMAKTAASPPAGAFPAGWREERGRRAEGWEDGDDACNSHVLALTSRLQTQMNLQLCFINNSESEEEEEEEKKEQTSSKEGSTCRVQNHPGPPVKPQRSKSRVFKNPLRSLRERLRPAAAAASASVVQRRVLGLGDLQGFSTKEVSSQFASLSQAVQGPGPAEDGAGRHVAGSAGPHLSVTLHLSACSPN